MAIPTLETIWHNDRLDRRQDALFLYNFLVGEIAKRKRLGRRSSYVLNIDAEWGGGKSFFLERFRQQVELNGHVVAYMNAWRDDHAPDPYVAIMAAIDTAFAPYEKKRGKIGKAWTAVKSNGGRIVGKVAGGVVKTLIKKHVGIPTSDLLEIDDDNATLADAAQVAIDQSIEITTTEIDALFDKSLEAMIDHFQKTDAAMQTFREKLASAVEILNGADKKAPLFILVDELDRCRPSYAVQLLERMKHLFEVDGVVFVFATNSEQLKHSIAGAYGPGFDGFRYLKRFFDRTYVFDMVSDEARIAELCSGIDTTKLKIPGNDVIKFIASGCSSSNLDLRGTEHVIELIETSVSAWQYTGKIDLALLFPLCAAFYQTGSASWRDAEKHPSSRRVFGDVIRDQYRGEDDRRIYLQTVVGFALNKSHDLSSVGDYFSENQGKLSATDRYIYDAYADEYNGRPIHRGKPSIQASLPRLVINAGMFLTPTAVK